MKLTTYFTLLAYASAECPNACSGHGTCEQKDECKCYQNYQGNDCSERTCYFGIAHVDTPKGDLNADGMVSGPLTTVITGSEVYPWGTTEQFPNADANEGHFYMECSNKGICDRKSGLCECFDGYEGTACIRASCPNDCSGHGTCETIKELAEMKTYDTNGGDVATTTPVGVTESTPQCTDPDGGAVCSAVALSTEESCTSVVDASGNACVYSNKVGHHNFDLSIEESYSYDLWDQDKTMGCKCDAVYYGADCSLKKCKYGVDPLFFDDNNGRVHQTSIIHLGNTDRAGPIGGTFNIAFFDVFGEKYTTKAIDATAATTSAQKVQDALEALPNGVISRTHKDVTFENGAGSPEAQAKSASVSVSMQKETGSITTVGTIGAGAAGGLSGTALYHAKGITAANHPTGHDGGVGMGAMGGGDGIDDVFAYGPEFTITFSTNPGVLRTIELDTRQVTNPGKTDYWVANARQGQFSSRYSTNVGRINSLRYGSKLVYTNADWTTTVPIDTLVKVGGQETIITAVHAYMVKMHDPFLGASIVPVLTDTKITGTALSRGAVTAGADTFTFTTAAAGKVTLATIPDIAANAKLYVNGCPFSSMGTKYDGSALLDDAVDLKLEPTNDCPTDAFAPATLTLYRRSDKTANQNLYKTSADTGAVAAVAMCTTRGSVDVYGCEAKTDQVASVAATGIFTTVATVSAGIVDDDVLFVNGHGPLIATSTDATTFTDTGAGVSFDAGGAAIWPVEEALTQSQLVAGKVMLVDGRRYKVKSTATAGGQANAKITLTETYAGGQFVELCSDCVTEVALNAITLDTKQTLAVGDQLMVSGQTHQQLMVSVKTVVTEGTAITTSGGNYNGVPAGLTPQNNGGNALSGTSRLSLYKALNQNLFQPILVTESKSAVTYQYVSQCANRGSCDGSTGLCTCYKGYSNDNCDTQNSMAI